MQNQYDVIAIGCGVSNLSFLALSESTQLNVLGLDENSEYFWYKDMLLDGVIMQTPYIEDIVTIIDPTSRYSFLNYLAKNGKIIQFIAAHITYPSRQEFNDYLRWVSNQLHDQGKIKYSSKVISVNQDKSLYKIQTASGEVYHSRHIVIGTGLTPKIPESFSNSLGENIFHSDNFISSIEKTNIKGKRILIVGGGQSSLEIYNYFLDRNNHLRELDFASSLSHLSPLDDSPFASELYTKSYVEYFHQLTQSAQKKEIMDTYHTNNGVSEKLLLDIYQKLYAIQLVEHKNDFTNIYLSSWVELLSESNDGVCVSIKNHKDKSVNRKTYDLVVLATGYTGSSADFIQDEVESTHLSEKYCLSCQRNAYNRTYIQNLNSLSYGISDHTLSIAPIRSAVIINDIMGIDFYTVNDKNFIRR